MDGRFRVRASEEQVLEMHVFSPTDEERANGYVGIPDSEREVVVPGVVAGTTDLVIRMK